MSKSSQRIRHSEFVILSSFGIRPCLLGGRRDKGDQAGIQETGVAGFAPTGRKVMAGRFSARNRVPPKELTAPEGRKNISSDSSKAFRPAGA